MLTVLSLTKVAARLRGPQYATISTSSSLHSALHVAAGQLERMTRSAPSPAAEAARQGRPGGPVRLGGPGGPGGPASHRFQPTWQHAATRHLGEGLPAR